MEEGDTKTCSDTDRYCLANKESRKKAERKEEKEKQTPLNLIFSCQTRRPQWRGTEPAGAAKPQALGGTRAFFANLPLLSSLFSFSLFSLPFFFFFFFFSLPLSLHPPPPSLSSSFLYSSDRAIRVLAALLPLAACAVFNVRDYGAKVRCTLSLTDGRVVISAYAFCPQGDGKTVDSTAVRSVLY